MTLLFASGCAHMKNVSSKQELDKKETSPKTVGDIIQHDINKNSAENPSGASTPLANRPVTPEMVIQGVKLRNTQFDIPVVVNSRVEAWVDYFTGRGRLYFEKYLERSKFFIPYIGPLLKQNGMPEDLVYLAMIESGFNNLARSRARAVGPWQFMSATGKRYGLMVNWWVDERRDIRKSTLAAVEYLKDLYGMFHGWELAASAYNAGEAKVARAVQRFGSRDFWVISRHRFLRPETRDYVPKMMAAAILAKNRDLFGFPVENEVKPAADEAVAGDGEIVKVIKTDKTEDKDDKLGKEDAIRPDMDDDEDDDDRRDSGITPATLTVPVEPGTVGGESIPLAKPIATPHVNKDGAVGGEQLAEFEVRSPADLLKVARAAGLSYQTVKSLNPELLRWCTPPTVSSYRIRLPASTKEKFLVTYNHDAYPRKVQFLTYKVRRGETLARIAKHYGIKVDPISDLNGISPRMPLRNGARVLLPIPTDRSRSLASLDLKDPPEKRRRRHRRRGSRYYKISYKRREAARVADPGALSGVNGGT